MFSLTNVFLLDVFSSILTIFFEYFFKHFTLVKCDDCKCIAKVEKCQIVNKFIEIKKVANASFNQMFGLFYLNKIIKLTLSSDINLN